MGSAITPYFGHALISLVSAAVPHITHRRAHPHQPSQHFQSHLSNHLLNRGLRD